MSTERSDTELVEKVRAGCERSFEELIGRYNTKAFNLALRLTRNYEDAEEVLHDAFVSAYRKLDAFEGKSSFSSWFYRITVNAALMKLRKLKNKRMLSLEDVNPSIRASWQTERSEEYPDKVTYRAQLQELLSAAIEKLPEEYRVVFVMRDVSGLSNREVSSILNLSIPAVKSRLHRARLMLRKRLAKHYHEFLDYRPDEIDAQDEAWD